MRVLLVENEVRLAYLMRRTLTQEGHTVSVVDDARACLRAVERQLHDVLIIDRLLPDADGLDICRHLRAKKIAMPALLLIDDPMAGTERPDPQRGADDYLLKPFAMRELLARLNDLSRRRGLPARSATCLELADLCLDVVQRQAKRGRRTVDLTDEECAILQYLMGAPGRVRTRTEIADHVWGYDLNAAAPAVDSHVRHLRKKIDGGAARHLIRQVYEAGYTIET